MNHNDDQETQTATPTGVEARLARPGGLSYLHIPQSTSISRPPSTSRSSAGRYTGATPTTLVSMAGPATSAARG